MVHVPVGSSVTKSTLCVIKSMSTVIRPPVRDSMVARGSGC